jgi:hypothetical protein
LKTGQSIRPEEADALERRWESTYGAVRANRKIAVLGKGTEFKPLSFTPEVVKLFELKRWNLYTILAKYFLMAAGAAFFTPREWRTSMISPQLYPARTRGNSQRSCSHLVAAIT